MNNFEEFSLDQTFNSYTKLKTLIDAYEKRTHLQLSHTNTTLLEKMKNCPKHINQEYYSHLKYYNLELVCEFGCKRNSTATIR